MKGYKVTEAKIYCHTRYKLFGVVPHLDPSLSILSSDISFFKAEAMI